MTQRFVLDAWAILALLQKEEPAASRVRQLLQAAQTGQVSVFISVINLGEVYYRVGKRRGEGEGQDTIKEIRRLSVVIVPATDERVLAAASFKARQAISYADAFAAATAAEFGAILLTGDPELEQLQGAIQPEKLSRENK